MSDLDRISRGVQDPAVRAALARIVEMFNSVLADIEDLIDRVEVLENL
jgi:hypothetical protein